MSDSPEYSEFTFSKAGNQLEKPNNFTQTCSMLSHYLKEKGSFGDLSLGMACNADTIETTESSCIPTTMSLFPINDKPADATISRDTASSQRTNSMNLFPQQSGFSRYAPMENSLKTCDRSVMNPVKKARQAAQMTIFYNGEVTVFNDFPADKAKEIMLIASKGSTQTYSFLNTNKPKSQTSAFATTNHSQSRLPAPHSPTSTPKFVNNRNTQGRTQALPEKYAYDMPQARNASINRFLERRKDRNTGNVPYQKNSQATSSYNPAETKPWFGLGTVQSP